MSGISFTQIPTTLRTPGQYVEFDNSKANKGLVQDAQRVLLIAQKLPTGTAPANVPVRVTAADQGVTLGGRGSMLAAMVAAFKTANAETDLWVLPVADNVAGQAATGSVTVTGPASAAGTLNLYIGGRRVQVGVAAGATAAIIATDLAAAVTANPDLSVTGAVEGVDTGKVTLTARHKGETAGALDLRVNYHMGEATPAGLTVTIAPMAGGTGNPDLTAALVALGDVQYHHLILPYTDAANLAMVVEEFTDRWSAMRQIEGQVWAAAAGNHAGLTTLGNSLNSEVLSVLGLYASPTPAYEAAAVYGAVCSFNLGIDPARPLQTLLLRGILAPAEKDRFTRQERNLLLYDGIATLTVAPDGRCAVERTVTTYQVNGYGLPDPSYLDAETPATLSVLRQTWRAWVSQRYPRHKLADDGTNFAPGQAIVTPSIMRGEALAWARACEARSWLENVEAFKAGLLVERDDSDPNRLNLLMPPDLVNQLRVLASLVQFRV